MIVLYTLAGAWSLGMAFAYLAVLKMVWGDDAYDRPWLGLGATVLIGLPVVVFLALLPWAAFEYEKSPDLVTLKKAEWACSASHDETTYFLVDKVMVPSTTTVCDQYGRI